MRKKDIQDLKDINKIARLRKDRQSKELLSTIDKLHSIIEEKPRDIKVDSKILELKTELAELRATNKSLLNELVSLEKRCEFMQGISKDPRNSKWELLQKKRKSKSTAIIGLFDWHVEERVDGNTIDNINHFDLNVAEKRIKRTFEKALYMIEYARHVSSIDNLVLAILGDMITGYIHDELIENNYLSPTEASLFVQDMLCSGIEMLLKEAKVESIMIPCCHGNHGRTTPSRLVSTSYKNSYEWQLYHQLARYYKSNSKVSFKIENGIHNWIDVQGYSVRLHHGDHIKFQGGVGGITIPVNKKIAQWNKARVADLDIFGHYHQFLHHWKWICGGSLIGYNMYAQSIGADYQPPTQLFVVINKEYGKVLAEPIFCEE